MSTLRGETRVVQSGMSRVTCFLLPVSWSAESRKFPVLRPGPETQRAMKRSNFTEALVALIPKQAEEGTPVAEVCRKAGISDATFYGWRKK